MSIKARIAAGIVVVAAIAPAAGHGAEPSAGCGGGTAAGTSGVVAKPGSSDVIVCNNGATAPAPTKGALTLRGDSAAQNVIVDFDGDSNNNTRTCTDGFARVKVDAAGPHFYSSPNGNYTDTDPAKKGNQTATEQDAPTFVGNAQTTCQ